MISCAIIIRTFNEEKHIGRLLEGIGQQTLQPQQVILVDSGSTDRTVEIARGFGAQVETILPQEFSFGRALNRGLSVCQGEVAVMVSAHCYPVYPDWLEQLTKPFTDPQVGLCYGKQRGGQTNTYSEQQFFRKYFPEVSQPRQGQPYSHNANAAIRRKLWETHPYNEGLTGLEDLAWSSWLMSQGGAIAYSAEAEVVHVHDESPWQVYNRHRREALALRQILPDSRFSLWNFLRLWSSATLSDLASARREGVLAKRWREILWFRLMQYWGTYRGYHLTGKVDARLKQVFYYPPHILAEKTPAARPVEPIRYEKQDK